LSTDRSAFRLRRVVTAIAAALAASLLPAAEWQLLPSVDLAYYRDGNVNVVSPAEVSDEVVRVGATLDWSVRTPNDEFRLIYAPYHESYLDLSDLDFTSHQLSIGVSREASRRSSFRLDLNGWLTQRQAIQTLVPNSPVTLVPRSEQLNLYLDLGGRVGAGRRSFFEYRADGSLNDYRQDAAGGTPPQDSQAAGISVGWGFELNPSSDLGARVRARKLSFDVDPTTDTAAFELFFGHEFSRQTSMSASVGAVRSSTGSVESTEPTYEISATRTLRGGSALEGGARQGVSNYSGVETATLDRGAWFSVRPETRSERFSTHVTIYYWRREAVDAVSSTLDVETFEGIAALAWSPKGGAFAFGGFYSYHDQNDLSGSGTGVETSYGSGGFFFRWSFRGAQGVRS
jgi:hypothetical protein